MAKEQHADEKIQVPGTRQWIKQSVCMHVCVCVYVCVLGGEWNRVFASTALVVVWMAMYLTSYSDYVTGFHTPPSPP